MLATAVIVGVTIAAVAGSTVGQAAGRAIAPKPGTWQSIPAAPIGKIDQGPVAVWTGTQLIVFGRRTSLTQGEVERVYLAAAYDPAAVPARRWTRLPAPPEWADGIYGYSAVWTGEEVLVWGQGIRAAFDPSTQSWRQLPQQPVLDGAAVVVWTGHEMIGWGGGCCGDAWGDGPAYDPATDTWRTVAPAPLAPSQHPIGAWTGRELIVLVNGLDPDGNPYPAKRARAAAYDPVTNTWRRIAPLPARRDGAVAVWDGHEVLVVGGAGAPRAGKPALLARAGFAYNPATNRWRRLAPMTSGRTRFAAVWTGTRLLVWGGTTTSGGPPQSPPRGFAYDPRTNRWSALPQAPLRGRLDLTATWTGMGMIVWGGGTGRPPYRSYTDGAYYIPPAP